MKEFSEDEKIIARNINKKYEWMARDRNGCLYIFNEKPKKLLNVWNVIFDGLPYRFEKLVAFSHMFSSVKWGDDEPTRICDIYDPQILNKAERKYLKAALKPFYKKVDYIKKYGRNIRRDGTCANEYLFIAFQGGYFTFPDFDKGKMYTGMELNKKYTLKELGITYKDVINDLCNQPNSCKWVDGR